MFVDASLPRGWFFTVLLLLSLASREQCSFPLASKNNNCKWQFARCVQTFETQIFLNLRVHCTNVLDLEEVHPCSGYSSTNLDRIRLQNSRFCSLRSQNRFSVTKESRATVSSQSRYPFSASLQTFCLTACAYLDTQKYGLFCSLWSYGNLEMLAFAERGDRSTRGKTFLNNERTNIKLKPLMVSLLGPSNISVTRVVSFLPSTCS